MCGKDCTVYWEIPSPPDVRKYRNRKENWLQRIIRDIKYKIWFNKNWK